MTDADNDRVVAALEGLLDLCCEFEGQSYGLFLGGDPRRFEPDRECCTPEEIAAWETACAEWNRGEGVDRGPGCATMGDGSAWTGIGFGVGTTTLVCDEITHARAALPIARAMAALVAAVGDTEGTCQNCLMLSGFLSACGAHRALEEYRRALGEAS